MALIPIRSAEWGTATAGAEREQRARPALRGFTGRGASTFRAVPLAGECASGWSSRRASAGTSRARHGEVWRGMCLTWDGKAPVPTASMACSMTPCAREWMPGRRPSMGAGPPPFPPYRVPGTRRRHPRHDGLRARSDVAGWSGIPDTKLTWIAVNHHNTDNPHARHSACAGRGGRTDGADLVIPRQYISYGIRDRASEWRPNCWGNGHLRRSNWPSPRRLKRSDSPHWIG